MFKPRNILLTLALVLILMVVATPKLVGMSLRTAAVDNLFALIPPETMRQLEINETGFNSGWFGSNASYEVAYQTFGAQEPLTMDLEFNFSHGPVMLTSSGMQIGLAHAEIIPSLNSRELTEAISTVPFDLPAIGLSLLAGFDQSLTIELVIAPATVTEPEVSVSFDGLTGTLLANADQSAEVQMLMGSFSAEESSSGMGFTLEGMNLESQLSRMNDLLAPSEALLTIPAISSNGPLAFAASDISASSNLTTTTNSSDQVDVRQRLIIANIDSELPLQSVTWTLEINELATELVRSYYELLGTMQEQLSSSVTGPDTALDELGEKMLLLLVQNSLVFNNYLNATLFEGEHSLDILVRWLGLPQTAAVDELAIANIFSAMQLDIDLSMDLEAVMRSPLSGLVDPYVQQGYITLDNGRVLLDLSLNDSELTINGERTSLEQFFPSQNL